MNLFLFEPAELASNSTVSVGADDARARLGELEVQPGDIIRVGQVGGMLGKGEVIEAERATFRVRVTFDQAPTPEPLVDLVLALPRPQMLKRILENCAALGIGSLTLVCSSKAEKSFLNSGALQPEEIRRRLLFGLSQSITTYLPSVQLIKSGREFFGEALSRLTEKSPLRIIAHPGSERKLSELRGIDPSERVLIAIGPESGWTSQEVERFRNAGFEEYSLGERILRVESAVYHVLAQFELLRDLRCGKVNNQRQMQTTVVG
jgi:16S rRNA (uracil1498-N3)-methyltransferase